MDSELALARTALTTGDRPADCTVPEIDAALEALKPGLPLKRSEPGLDGQGARLAEDALRVIGAAVDPRMNNEQAKAWRKAVLLKLSNLPADVLVKAIRAAWHTSFRFLGDVEEEVRTQAKVIEGQRAAVKLRLERWRAELERALNPQPQLEAPKEPATQEEVDRVNATLASAGVKTRYRLANGQIELDPDPPPPTEGVG